MGDNLLDRHQFPPPMICSPDGEGGLLSLAEVGRGGWAASRPLVSQEGLRAPGLQESRGRRACGAGEGGRRTIPLWFS